MNDEVRDRLEKLEGHVAHLEHELEVLNGVIVEQEKTIGVLKKLVQRQGETMEAMELDSIKANNAKPPHYG